jgi:hypothetical protein
MKLEIVEEIAEAFARQGYEVDIREDYSGRCMYGATTAGFVCGIHPSHMQSELFDIYADILEYADEPIVRDDFEDEEDYKEEVLSHIPSYSYDNMAMDYIYY